MFSKVFRQIPQSRNFMNFSQKFKFSTYDYDLVIIGGGPAGYVGAIKAGQLGLKTACIEKRDALGGTCLNVGCIPSKALLNISHKYEEASKHYKELGIDIESVSLNWGQVQIKKNKIVSGLTKGIEGLFRKNKVDYIQGWGKFEDTNTINVDLNKGGQKKITSKNILLCTGSESISFPNLPFDEKIVISSTGALSLPKIPKEMVIIGGGVIGLELGQVYQRFGTKVTVVEYMDRIVNVADAEISKTFHKILVKQGMQIFTNHKVISGINHGTHGEVTFEPVNGGQKTTLKCDHILVGTGRKPFSGGLNADKIGLQMDKKERMIVNKEFQTNHPNIFAVGDLIDGPMLAHKAEEEAIAAIEFITGSHGHVNYDTIPSVIYSHPEVAWVGLNEEQLTAQGIKYKKGVFPFLANSRAKAVDDVDGMIKVLADVQTDKILGCHIIGPSAGELIAEAVLGMEYGASSEDIGRTCHAHPTLSEALKEACMATYNKPIHF